MATQEEYDLLRLYIAEDAAAYPDELLDTFLNPTAYDLDGVVAYDLHRAASRIWLVKAGELAKRSYDVQVDATKANRTAQYKNAFTQYRVHARQAMPQTMHFVSPAGLTSSVSEE